MKLTKSRLKKQQGACLKGTVMALLFLFHITRLKSITIVRTSRLPEVLQKVQLPCHCDKVVGTCELNCCCDSDCLPDQLAAFDCKHINNRNHFKHACKCQDQEDLWSFYKTEIKSFFGASESSNENAELGSSINQFPTDYFAFENDFHVDSRQLYASQRSLLLHQPQNSIFCLKSQNLPQIFDFLNPQVAPSKLFGASESLFRSRDAKWSAHQVEIIENESVNPLINPAAFSTKFKLTRLESEPLLADLFFELAGLEYKQVTSGDRAFKFLRTDRVTRQCFLAAAPKLVDSDLQTGAGGAFFPVSLRGECRLSCSHFSQLFDCPELLLSDLFISSSEISNFRGGFAKLSLENNVIYVQNLIKQVNGQDFLVTDYKIITDSSQEKNPEDVYISMSELDSLLRVRVEKLDQVFTRNEAAQLQSVELGTKDECTFWGLLWKVGYIFVYQLVTDGTPQIEEVRVRVHLRNVGMECLQISAHLVTFEYFYVNSSNLDNFERFYQISSPKLQAFNMKSYIDEFSFSFYNSLQHYLYKSNFWGRSSGLEDFRTVKASLAGYLFGEPISSFFDLDSSIFPNFTNKFVFSPFGLDSTCLESSKEFLPVELRFGETKEQSCLVSKNIFGSFSDDQICLNYNARVLALIDLEYLRKYVVLRQPGLQTSDQTDQIRFDTEALDQLLVERTAINEEADGTINSSSIKTCQQMLSTFKITVFYSNNDVLQVESLGISLEYSDVLFDDFEKFKLRLIVTFQEESSYFDFLKIDYDFSVITDEIKSFFKNAYNNIKNLFS